jgi:hypothetical protein
VSHRCQEHSDRPECGRPATHLVGIPGLGFYYACAEHAKLWVPGFRKKLKG